MIERSEVALEGWYPGTTRTSIALEGWFRTEADISVPESGLTTFQRPSKGTFEKPSKGTFQRSR